MLRGAAPLGCPVFSIRHNRGIAVFVLKCTQLCGVNLMFRSQALRIYEFSDRVMPRFRGWLFHFLFGLPFRRIGRQLTIRGGRAISIGEFVSVGDGCWIEAVVSYRGHAYSPRLTIGNHVSISNWSHISCAKEINLGDGCLIGSKVFIGDHSHGSPWTGGGEVPVFPGHMPLADFESIDIGAGTWICDGAIILAGTRIAPGSIIGANSVVRLQEERAALIAGAPARVLKFLK
jgi:acetyltransferase-like isoleucine patch superfamily enzyme